MNALKKYTPFFASAVLMWIALYIIYPHYQYYIDPDGTAYLTISRRYAAGDHARAINGYWSPWSCWLTAALIKVGLQPIPASVIINTLGATGFLYISQSFFLRFGILQKMQWLLNVTLAFFLVYAIFWQSFDDLWECFFLLVTLRIILAERFLQRPGLWVATGLVGALAYFAKAYSFPFFILNTICCTYLLARTQKGKWLTPALVCVATMAVCSLPWIYALHNKYGIWTTSTAGSLNMSWYLVGHPIWKDGITHLLPPPYPDSPYYWEDPWFVNGATPHFWDSWHLFGLQLLRIGYNGYKLLRSMIALSVFFPLVSLLAVAMLMRKRIAEKFPADLRIVALSMLLFPLGYIPINYESRYLWYMVPLSMVIAVLAIERYSVRMSPKLVMLLLPLTYLFYPAWELHSMYNEGKEEYVLAGKMRTAGIHEAFTGDASPRVMSKLAYLSGNTYYSVNLLDKQDTAVMVKEMRRYGISNYLHFSSFILCDLKDKVPAGKSPQLLDSSRKYKVWLIRP